MAKSKAAGVPLKPRKHDEWEVRDAMHTLMRAEEIQGDTKLMELVRKEAAKEAAKMQEVSRRADSLAKRGLVSDKQLAKLKK